MQRLHLLLGLSLKLPGGLLYLRLHLMVLEVPEPASLLFLEELVTADLGPIQQRELLGL